MIISLFVRKKNNKHVVICEYRDEKTKKRKQKQLGSFEKKKDANTFLAKEKLKTTQGIFALPSEIKLYSYLTNWNDSRLENSIQRSTWSHYKGMIDSRIKDMNFGHIKLTNITPLLVDDFYNNLRKNGLSNNTVIKYHRLLHKAFEDAKRKQLVSSNPIDYVERPKIKKSKTKSLTVEEAINLLDVSINTIYEVPVNLALGLGLRAGEILGLSWDNVDFDNNKITISRVTSLDKSNGEVFFKEPKTENSNRILIAPVALMKILKKHKLKQKPNKYNLLVTKQNGELMSSSTFSRNFRGFLKRNKIEYFRFHDLRHTNASLHLLAGTDMKVTSKNLGHSNIGITADLYTHVLTQLENVAAENINSVLYEKFKKFN